MPLVTLRHANHGNGMGFTLMGSRVSGRSVRHIIRLIVSAFIYVYARQDAMIVLVVSCLASAPFTSLSLAPTSNV
jgi:hypothetical protein